MDDNDNTLLSGNNLKSISLVGKVIDFVFPFPGIPFDLERQINRNMEEYEKVLKGEITDPAEVERITEGFEHSYSQFQNIIENWKR